MRIALRDQRSRRTTLALPGYRNALLANTLTQLGLKLSLLDLTRCNT